MTEPLGAHAREEEEELPDEGYLEVPEEADEPEQVGLELDAPEGVDPDPDNPEEASDAEPAQTAPNYNQVAAKLRTKERDFGILSTRFDQVVGMMNQMMTQQQQLQFQQQQQGQEQEEPIDPEEDPAKYLVDQVGKINQRLDAGDQQAVQSQQVQAQQQVVTAAMGAAKQVWDQNPEAAKGAIQHLFDLSMEDLKSLYPSYTEDQLGGHVQNELMNRMVTLHQAGHNPGEYILEMAKRRGFVAPASANGDDEDASEALLDPRSQVRQAKTKQKKSRSLSNLSGVSSRTGKRTAKNMLKLSEDDFADEMRKTGMKFQDLLRSKARRDVNPGLDD